MSEITQNKNIKDELSLYSLNKFYKTCMHILSNQYNFEETHDKEKLFLLCYEKLNDAFLLINHHLSSSMNIKKENEDSEVI